MAGSYDLRQYTRECVVMTTGATSLIETKADSAIRECLESNRNFSMNAGAGSGKTTSLINALEYIREANGNTLRRSGKRIACITYTNRAVDVISGRLGWDELFCVSTIHGFLWGEVKRFTPNIRSVLQNTIIPAYIAKKQADDNGGTSKKAIAAREKVESLLQSLEDLNQVSVFTYIDNNYSTYSEGKLGHDDIITVSALMILENELLRKIIGQKYPYIFVDEAQDTFSNVVEALNKICELDGLPIVGYFGDPMQQIYEKRTGNFAGPPNSDYITKIENFRCSQCVIKLLNSFRKDIQQVAAGDNSNEDGSVEIRLVKAEAPEAPRNRYSEEQLVRASERFENVMEYWGWNGRENIKSLFLVRQMIARRLGFPKFQRLFTGEYASTRAQEEYEAGNHPLLKPFIRTVWPLVKSFRADDMRSVVKTLRISSPAFDPEGVNAKRSLGEMKELAVKLVAELVELWSKATLGDILKFCRESDLSSIPERVLDDLTRDPMKEEYNKDLHSSEKGRWLADVFFNMSPSEVSPFVDFINKNTPFSTQHGVKGEQYNDVVVVFDDTEAAWGQYSFSKTLTPDTSGGATEGQLLRSTKLAYVCFSRAKINLRIVLFTPKPEAAKKELISAKLFDEDQISIAD